MMSREDHLMIKQMRRQGAYIVDIAIPIGCGYMPICAALFMSRMYLSGTASACRFGILNLGARNVTRLPAADLPQCF
jgi:hypothetical protein